MNIPSFNPLPEIERLWDEINEAIQRVLKHGQFILGPEVQELEEKVAAYMGVKHAVGVNSGTDALVIGMRAAGIGPGDEVITTPFSFFATAESISNIGARPVFVDIDGQTLNLDPDKIERAVTDKTRAILPVHLFGHPADMGRIMKIAAAHELTVIEDCAQSFGATYYYGGHIEAGEGRSALKGIKTGAIGDVGAFSFFPTKNLGGIGDGGMIVTDNDEIADTARMLRTHGSRKKYQNEQLGYNSRLDTIQAAALLVKLSHIDEFNRQRREVAEYYNRELEGVDGIAVPGLDEGAVFHQYTIRIGNGMRDEVQRMLKERGISSAVYYPIPQDRLPVYRGAYPRLPVSEKASDEVLSLPIWPAIPPEMVKRTADALKEIMAAT